MRPIGSHSEAREPRFQQHRQGANDRVRQWTHLFACLTFEAGSHVSQAGLTLAKKSWEALDFPHLPDCASLVLGLEAHTIMPHLCCAGI